MVMLEGRYEGGHDLKAHCFPVEVRCLDILPREELYDLLDSLYLPPFGQVKDDALQVSAGYFSLLLVSRWS